MKRQVFDESMAQHDFMKLEHQEVLHLCYLARDEFLKRHKRTPLTWNLQDAQTFETICKELEPRVITNAAEFKSLSKLVRQFAFTCDGLGVLPPLAAFFGGYPSQEVIKALTGKFMPTKQLFYTDVVEVLPDGMCLEEWNKLTNSESLTQFKQKHGIPELGDSTEQNTN